MSDDDSKIIYVNGSYQDSDSNDTNEKSYKTIQEAIDAASSGDMISIAAGTYTENLTINKKIILSGVAESSDGYSTQIIGKISVMVVDAVTLENLNLRYTSTTNDFQAVVELNAAGNLTIQNVIITPDIQSNEDYCSGVLISENNQNAKLTINNATIHADKDGGRGVAIRSLGSTTNIFDSTITANGGKYGSAIHMNTQDSANPATLNISNSTITAQKYYGIYLHMGTFTINIDNSKVSGFAALYLKPDCVNSTVNISKSELTGIMQYGGYSNNFGTIVFEGHNNTINISDNSIVTNKYITGGECCEYLVLYSSNGANDNSVIADSTVKFTNVNVEKSPIWISYNSNSNNISVNGAQFLYADNGSLKSAPIILKDKSGQVKNAVSTFTYTLYLLDNDDIIEIAANTEYESLVVPGIKISFSIIGNNSTIKGLSLSVAQNNTVNISISKVNFIEKGLAISGANNVTITGCKFTDITESVVDGDSTQVNAIYLENCTGDVMIGGEMEDDKNAIENVSSSDSNPSPQYGRGIFISYGGSGKSLTIQNNSISGTAYNALQLSNIEFTEITISNNKINNWDSDNDGVEDKPGSSDFSKGRAIRLNVNEGNSTKLTISDNKFTKTYNAETLYDDYNIIKISDADAEFTNNILVLSGLNDTKNNPDLFMTGTNNEDKYIAIFNPTDGYFKDSSETNELLYSIVAENGIVDEPTSPSRLGSYSFAGWYTDESLTDKWDFDTTINGDMTLYAKWTYIGGSGGYPVNPPVTPDTPEEPIIPDSSGNAEIKVDDKKADELVHETVASGSNTLSIVDKDNVEGTVTSVSISVSDLETISKKIENNNNIDSISIATSEGEVIIEKEVLAEILENNSEADTLIIEVNNAENKLTEEQKKVVGDNPVYDINLRLGDKYVTSFNGKSITVSIPYELKEGEDQNNLIVYYLKDDGSIEKMNCSYKDNQVSFETNHLSKFIIVYEAQEPIVPDNPDDKNDDNNSDNTVYYIIAAVIIILIIIALAYYFMKKK